MLTPDGRPGAIKTGILEDLFFKIVFPVLCYPRQGHPYEAV